MDNEKKVWLAFQCGEVQKLIYKEAAKEKGVSFSAFVRELLDKAALDIFTDMVEREFYSGKLQKVKHETPS